MSRLSVQYTSSIFKQFQIYLVNKPYLRFCNIWYTYMINNIVNSPNQTLAYKDMKEVQYYYSFIILCEDFNSRALVLYELRS